MMRASAHHRLVQDNFALRAPPRLLLGGTRR